MRKGLWIVAAVALLGSSVAMAQDQGPRSEDRGRPAAGQHQDRPDAGQNNRPAAEARPQTQARRAPTHRPPSAARPPYGPRPAHRFLVGGGWHRSVHGPAFAYPSGFSYRVWTTGAILPGVFLSGSYFYDDYAALGLAPPPAGYRWVRYGPDLLLVNVVSGRVADVVDGVFY